LRIHRRASKGCPGKVCRRARPEMGQRAKSKPDVAKFMPAMMCRKLAGRGRHVKLNQPAFAGIQPEEN
jgi:hypothetical protein